MKLSQVLPEAVIMRRDADPQLEISSLAYDSREAGLGALFFALPGAKADGHDFAAAAVAGGAAAVVAERWLAELPGPQVQVRDARQAMAAAAANFYGRPADRLTVTGVTGTNGKTTTTFLLDSILQADGRITGLVGGVEYRIAGERSPAVRTTPEAPDLERALARMVDAGAEFATLEVSSHGIDFMRTACITFDVAVFTNLTRDHLDLHGDMEKYYQTKRRLFLPGSGPACPDQPAARPRAAVNVDDAYGRRLYDELGPETAVSFSAAGAADITAAGVDAASWGFLFNLVTPAGSFPVCLQLPGSHNLDNALAAAAAAHQLKVPPEAIVHGIESLASVPGRFEPVSADAPFQVVVDYAHNENGLERVLETARRVTGRRLILVFGCPGERDRDKRPAMGRIAGAMADLAILTTDDCYGEPPEQILNETEPGLAASGGDYLRIEDRRAAIEAALDAASEGDLVLIAGKGHETRQMMLGGALPFSDSEVVKEILKK